MNRDATPLTTTIRDADARNIPAITAISNDAVRHTTAMWNATLVDHANRAAWLAARTNAGFPVLVAVDATGAAPGSAPC